VANAAVSVREPVIEAQWENVSRTIQVSRFGVFHTCQAAVQQMIKQGYGGKIVITSSVLEMTQIQSHRVSRRIPGQGLSFIKEHRTLPSRQLPQHMPVYPSFFLTGMIDFGERRSASPPQQFRKCSYRQGNPIPACCS
jgi:NAD(P)-dependent dehydrogenase (short-subunit alcohol dehydrogenase family)